MSRDRCRHNLRGQRACRSFLYIVVASEMKNTREQAREMCIHSSMGIRQICSSHFRVGDMHTSIVSLPKRMKKAKNVTKVHAKPVLGGNFARESFLNKNLTMGTGAQVPGS